MTITEITIVWYRFSQQLLPPIHENCRCYIETMPAGNKIWQFSDNCCDQCRTLAVEFNKNQNPIANQPAQIDPSGATGLLQINNGLF